jgi:hypothetical protein
MLSMQEQIPNRVALLTEKVNAVVKEWLKRVPIKGGNFFSHAAGTKFLSQF